MSFRLQVEIGSEAKKKEVFACIGVILVAFCLINLLLGVYLLYHPINWGHLVIRHKWSLLRDAERTVDWLFTGDSSGNQGLSVDQFDKNANSNGLNLATYGGMGVYGDAVTLDYYIKHVGIPREGVVLIHVYDGWHRDLDLMAFSMLPVWDREFPVLPFDPRTDLVSRLRWWTYNALPLVTQGNVLGNYLRHSGAETPPLDFDEFGFMRWKQNDPELVKSNFRIHQQFLKSARFRVSSINRQSLDYIEQLANTHQFEVYLFNSPILDELKQTKNFGKYYSDLHHWMVNRTRSSDRLHWMSEHPFVFDESYLIGVDHLTVEGAKIFTDSVFQSIERWQKR